MSEGFLFSFLLPKLSRLRHIISGDEKKGSEESLWSPSHDF
jgi:hypothetical protein